MRQLADQYGHRWDVADVEESESTHRLRFTRDDGSEEVREADRPLNALTDIELRALLERVDPDDVKRGPDTESGSGYGDARD